MVCSASGPLASVYLVRGAPPAYGARAIVYYTVAVCAMRMHMVLYNIQQAGRPAAQVNDIHDHAYVYV